MVCNCLALLCTVHYHGVDMHDALAALVKHNVAEGLLHRPALQGRCWRALLLLPPRAHPVECRTACG